MNFELIIKVLQFFLCFTILVGLHELGHFAVARMFGIRIEKFYIFFDPWFSLFKWKRGDTEYGIGWIPLGGYVKIAGMIDESMDTEQMQQEPQPDEFRSKPAWQRFLVIIAGVVMNVLLAIAIYCAACFIWGETYLSNQDAKWGYNFNEEGHRLGFVDGDRILSIDGEEIDNFTRIVNDLLITDSGRSVEILRQGEPMTLEIPFESLLEMRRNKGYIGMIAPREPFIIDSIDYPSAAALTVGDEVVAIDSLRGADLPTYIDYLRGHAGEEVSLEVLRAESDPLHVTLPVDEKGRLGVVIRPFPIRTREYTFMEAIPAGFRRTGSVISSYWEQLKMIFQPKTKMYEELGGFIAIGNLFRPEWNWEDFWLKTAFLSIILAVMNILPIPGLDGGHAIFTFWEMITRRKVNEKVLLIAQYIGLALLLFLLLYANGNDIYRLIFK